MRSFLLLALLVAAASAFVAPSGNGIAAPRAFKPRSAPVAPVQMTVDGAELSAVADQANLLASSVSDFGGYLFPVFGLIGLAGLILFLAPPLADN